VEFLSRRVDAAILRVTYSAATTAAVGLVELKARIDVLESAHLEGRALA